MASLLSSLLLLGAAISPAQARVAAWWNGVGPQVIVQNETTGLIRYSRCNLFDNPKYSYTDGSVFSLTYKPKNDTPLAGSGYWSNEFTAASIYYLTERYEIANGLFHCNMTTGLFESKGNWIISKPSPSVHQNTGLASLLLGEEGGYRLFYHNKDGQVAQLGYTRDDGQWLYKGMVSKDVNTVPALGAAHSGKENITVVSTRDLSNIGVTRWNSAGTWWRSTLPQALENETDVITSKTNKTEIAINATAPVNFTLPAYDAATKGMGISIDRNYTRFIWYIGTDKKIHQIGNTNYFWSIRENQTESFWPEADEPNASVGVAFDFSSNLVHLYYMAKGKLVQVKYENESWKAWSNVPEPPAEQTTTDPTPSGPTTTESPVSEQSDVPNEGLSTGAQAGIGVGVSLGVIAVGVLIAVIVLLKRKKHEGFEHPPQQHTDDGSTIAPTTPAPSYGVPHPQNPSMVHYNNIAPQYHNYQMAQYDGYAWDQKYAPITSNSPPASQPYSSPQSTYAAMPIQQLDSETRPTELYAQPLYELPNQTNSHELVAEPKRTAAEQQKIYETQQLEQQRRAMYQQQQQQQQQQVQMYQGQPPQYQQLLTSHQYGVATVWLVSTVGIKSNAKKISRKAIQEVNVQKACETILEPGAPIALRLQGSLLYGVSRVYSQQCQYVLADAEKVQAHMMAFYNAMGGNENALDPRAGKAKRKELMLQDDPDFDLNYQLPVFELDDDGNLILPAVESQASRNSTSQMSPHQLDSFNAGGSSIHGGLDLPGSSSGLRNPFHDGPFGSDDIDHGMDNQQVLPFGDEERQLAPIDDWGIEIDADGNVLALFEEPELPQIPQVDVSKADDNLPSDLGLDRFDSEGDFIMGNRDPAIPSDPRLPSEPPVLPQVGQAQQEENQEQQQQEAEMDENASEVQAPARARRQRRRQLLAPDDQTMLTRGQIRLWGDTYANRADEETARRQRRGLTATETRMNAYNLVFGQGLANLGYLAGYPNIPHPLAPFFAGEGLAQQLGFISPDSDVSGDVPATPRSRRRTASQALELEEDEVARRVRPRLSNEPDAPQGAPQLTNEAQLFLLGEQGEPIEAGRRGTSAQLSDAIHSDAPWNRPSSHIPSSPIKGGAGSKPGSRHVSASPLTHRARAGILGGSDQIERFSDQPIFGSDTGFSQGGGGAFLSSDPIVDPIDAPQEIKVPADTSQQMINALDREGQNFARFLRHIAKTKGYANEDDEQDEKAWVSFDDLFEPEDRKRAVVVQAFHHVLTLATKNVVKVKQDGQGGLKPFGEIRVGVDLPLSEDGGEEGEDEEMGDGGEESRIATGDDDEE
ncbi:R8 protein [Podospora pseudocomata]|uniref:R8 protein n=1 Tax=Podospora pseudocomata TaxID=2093779 RepID=A0ABR0GWE2_9PEZI|nr:R8 protein [Podospora pseudocomata]